jgi:hypothetical protein
MMANIRALRTIGFAFATITVTVVALAGVVVVETPRSATVPAPLEAVSTVAIV